MAAQNQTRRDHYVPQWYQRLFLPSGVDRFFYLDLTPDVVKTSPGRTFTLSRFFDGDRLGVFTRMTFTRLS
jgi:hypothetical protein